MYLLMLLATYMSAIYGYNLSIRPDYDRDVAHKKAAAVVYKFIYQHNAAKKIVLAVQREEYTATIPWVQPDDWFMRRIQMKQMKKLISFIT